MKTMLRAALHLTAAVALAIPAFAAPPAKPDPARPAEGLVEGSVALADLGFADGISFRGFTGRRDLYFPLPAWVGVQDIRLEGGIEAMVPAPIKGSAQLLVEDRPRWGATLDGQRAEPLALVIDHRDPTRPFVKVSLEYGAVWTQDRCMDQRLPGAYLTLRPDTVLRYRYDPATVTSLRGALSVLPRTVRVALSAQALGREQYEAALALGLELARKGHKLEFVRLGQADPPAQIIIAPAAEIAGTSVAAADGSTGVRLVRVGQAPVIALVEGAGASDVRMLFSAWQALAAGPALAARNAGAPAPADQERISFATMGLGDGIRQIADRGEWDLRFDYADVPRGQRPVALDLMLTPGAATDGRTQLAHIFVNDLLLRSVTLDGSGDTRRLTVPLPDGLVGRSNAIRLELQRQAEGGDCRTAPLAAPAQLLPASAVVMQADGGGPGDFFHLGADFADGVTVVVPAAALADPAPSLTLAVHALGGLVHGSEGLAVALDQGDGVRPDRPFLLLPGVKPPAGLPVALDRGVVKVTDRQGRVLLDVTGAPSMLVAQLAVQDGKPGLVLQTSGDRVTLPAALALDRGNVAFADDSGLLMAIDTVRERAVQVEIGEKSAWTDWLDRFRILLVVGIWLVVTLLVAGGFARWYRSRGKA